MANWERILLSQLIKRDREQGFTYVKSSGISSDDFSDPIARGVYQFIELFYSKYNSLPSDEAVLEKFPDFQFTNTADPLEAVVKQVISGSVHTHINYCFQSLKEKFYSNPWEACARIEDTIYRLRKRFDSNANKYLNIGSAISNFEIEYKQVQEGILIGLPYPWHTLTKVTRGAKSGELIAFYALPKMCKTWLLLVCCAEVLKAGNKVLLISREMHPEILFRRLLVILAKVNYSSFNYASLSEAEMQRVKDASKWLMEHKDLLCISDARTESGEVNVSSIRETAKSLIPKAIFIDGIHRLDDELSKDRVKDHRAFINVTQNLKDLAMQLNVPVFITSQANRYGEAGRHFKDVGYGLSLAQDADILLRLYHSKTNNQILALVVAARETDVESFLVRANIATDFSESPKPVAFDPKEFIAQTESEALRDNGESVAGIAESFKDEKTEF